MSRRGARALRSAGLALLVLAVGVVGGPRSLAGQEMNGQGGEEIRLLREASAREAAGNWAGAEQILRVVLARNAGSLSALLSLERVLRVQGRLEELIPPVERLLAQDPASAMGHQLRVRTLSELDRLDEVKAAADAWFRASPRLETPYREVARVFAARGDHAEASRILERGRSQVRRDDALALELGDAHAALGDFARAVSEWDRAIGPDARGFSLVRRRLSALPDGGARVLPGLIDALTRSSASVPRQRAALELAIEAGLGARAEEIARRVAALLPAGREREGYLVEVARRADGARLPGLAYWAYREILAAGAPDQRMMAVRSRLGELALIVGDTAAARESFLLVEKASAAGSPERRQAAAVRIELTAREGKVEEALRALEDYRREFADAPELDALSATIADRFLGRGDLEAAQTLIAGGTGPRATLVRGRIALLRGEVAAARAALLSAASRLEGAEATETLAQVTLLGKLSPGGGELLGQAMALAARGERAEAIALLTGRSAGLGGGERPALLDFAAGLADRAGLPAEAERVRRVIVADHADAAEAPAALLALGRALAERPAGLDEARHLLERLVLEYPRSALVPQARRELDRLQGRVPRS